MRNYSVVGKRLPRIDSVAQVTGEAKYTADIAIPRMLLGKILRSPYPHAKVMDIDCSKAERLPGVKAIITGKDILELGKGSRKPRLRDEHFLALDKVRFMGDEVAAVAATDEDIALEALDLIHVEYEPLPSVFDPMEAMKDEAPRIHDHVGNNIGHSLHLSFGDVEKALEDTFHIREDKFFIGPVHQGYLETQIALASWDLSCKLALWASTQIPNFIQRNLSSSLGIPRDRIRVIKPHIGGGHCGKVEMLSHHFCAALLSVKTSFPVKIELGREEVFVMNRGAHPVIMEIRTGVKRDGTLTAQVAKFIAEAGAYISGGPLLNFIAGTFMTLPYRLPNLKYGGYLIYTNNAPYTSQRAMGMIQVRFACESQWDMIAKDLGIDPVEIRLRNVMVPNFETINKLRVTSCGLEDCIKLAWSEAQRKKNGGKGRGIGIASGACCSGSKGFLPFDSSIAVVDVHDDGTATLLTGTSDLGQGSDTVLAQIVAEELGLSLEDVRVTSGDTRIDPLDLGSYGSRVTFQAGNAVLMAARDAKKGILELAQDFLEAKAEDLELREKKVYVKGFPEKGVPLYKILSSGYDKGITVIGKGCYNPASQVVDPKTHEGNPSLAYSFVASAAEVEIDLETGMLKVIKFTAAHDCGFALNPMAVEGQIEGQIAFGLGQASLEERLLEKGQVLNPSFLDYSLPTCLDIPEIKVILVETHDPNGPFGAKECGEGPQTSVVPAIGNALYDAMGIGIKELPLRPEKILDLIKEK